MKYFFFPILFFFCASLLSCSGVEDFISDIQPSGDMLELSVSAGDFSTHGDVPATRAADNDAATTFEDGDCVGVIVLEGTELKGNNLPYKYDGSTWSFDTQKVSEEGGSKSVYYYDNKATDVTYIVYYPYDVTVNDVTTLADLKSKFSPKENQQSESDYRVSDLMTWAPSSGNSKKQLTATLTHAYSSVSLLPQVHYILEDGNNTDFFYPRPNISDVNFIIGDKIYYAYAAEDGSYRCILPTGLSDNSSVRCLYTLDGSKTYSKELSVSSTANTRYCSTQTENAGRYNFDKVRVGDFYCRSGEGENSSGYLIPCEAVSLTDEQQSACVGVVYWVGNIATDSDDPLLKTEHSGCTHGLVAALHDVSDGTKWNDEGGEEITANWLSKLTNRPYGITSLKEGNKMQGYANTKALDAYNQSERVTGAPYRKVIPIDLIKDYAATHSAPANSSGWYWPSKKELQYMCWGQGANGGAGGRDILKQQLEKVYGASSFALSNYGSTTEYNYYYNNGNYAWYVYFGYGGVNYNPKTSTCMVRCALAF